MIREEAINLMRMILGFRTDLEAACITALQNAQISLELGPEKPWFLVSEISYADTVAGEPRVRVPTSMLQEVDNALMYYINDDAEKVELTKDEVDVLTRQYGNATSAAPKAYALDGLNFVFFPAPDAVYRIYMQFFEKDTTLDTNIENRWLKYIPNLLIGEAGLIISAAVRDKEAMKEFGRLRQEAALLLLSQNTDRDLANRELQIGGPH